MISRQKFLSRLPQTNIPPPHVQEEEDTWHHKEKLCKDHIHEVLSKWQQIDDEIWAKIVIFERNRRVAKAYARAPVLTVNGSDEEFDGFRIGLNGFDNPMKDRKTEEYKRHIGHGVKVKMDDAGNILIKRVSKCRIYAKSINPAEENAIGSEILKLSDCALQMEKPVKLFDMKKFQGNLKKELRKAYPDRRRLENQCLSAVAFVKNEHELLECPIWIMIINVVAIDMLKAKLPPNEEIFDIKERPRIPVPDEDPYSLPSSSSYVGRGSNASSTKEMILQNHQSLHRGERPPRLPPRENLKPHPASKASANGKVGGGHHPFALTKANGKSKEKKQYEDPYYYGLRARVSSFVSKTKSKLKKPITPSYPPPKEEAPLPPIEQNRQNVVSIRQHPMWYTRSIESGMNTDFMESPYIKIYGKIPVPRGYVPQHRMMHIGEWD